VKLRDRRSTVAPLRTGALVAAFRCAATARCGAFGDERRVVVGDEADGRARPWARRSPRALRFGTLAATSAPAGSNERERTLLFRNARNSPDRHRAETLPKKSPMRYSSMMTIQDYRHFYSQELRFVANLQTPGLVEAFARVPRERFLGPGPWEIGSAEQRAMAATGITQMHYTPVEDARDLYHNVVVVLDKARDINNGQPSALARWIDAMDLKSGDRAYHIGCGVGYYTAMMAEVVGAAGSVAASELQADLAARARENFSSYSNVTVHAGDGAVIDPGECGAILVNAGVNRIPALWLDCLRDGGRLIVPLTITTTPTIGQGLMVKIVRRGERYSAEVMTFVAIFSCGSLRDPESDAALRKALAGGALLKLKSLRRDVHDPCDTCLVHGAQMCMSAAD